MEVSIRSAKMTDLEEIVEIEKACFPPAEAAERETILERMTQFLENFFVAEIEGKLVGFINGCTTDSEVIFDEMFHDTKHHVKTGRYMAIFGLDVMSENRRKGIAEQLIKTFLNHAREESKIGVSLTCKETLITYYEKFGFKNKGVSDSVHGGAVWYDMMCDLN